MMMMTFIIIIVITINIMFVIILHINARSCVVRQDLAWDRINLH